MYTKDTLAAAQLREAAKLALLRDIPCRSAVRDAGADWEQLYADMPALLRGRFDEIKAMTIGTPQHVRQRRRHDFLHACAVWLEQGASFADDTAPPAPPAPPADWADTW